MNRSTGIYVMFLALLLAAFLPSGSKAQDAAGSDAREIKKQVRKLLKAGTVQFEAGLFDSAKTQFDSVLKLDPVNPDGPYFLARISLAQADTAATVAGLKEAVVKAPRSFRLKRFLARLHLALNEPTEAQKLVEEVLMIRQRDSEALYLKGCALLMAGDSTQAVELFGKALEITEARGKK